ncbi:MAG: polysaccharide deacetylase [Butyrivibrio sp.]|nr:polysaccharide deacetylase [Butyrivibrio sp.]
MAPDKDDKKSKKVYSKKITYLRRLIVGSVAASCLIPLCICIILAIRYDRLRSEYEQSRADLEWYRNRFGTEREILGSDGTEVAETEQTKQIDSQPQIDEPGAEENIQYDIDGSEVATDVDEDADDTANVENIEGTRYVYLTFDDGPSSSTDDILDVLKEYDVKATFFVCGKPDSRYTDLYKRIVDEGHTLGMHSYSHKYNVIYESTESFKDDLDKLRRFLNETTGTWSKYYRFPGGSSNTVSKADMKELVQCLNDEGITFFDWNVAGGDATGGATKATIYNNVVNNVPRFKHSIVLLHDSADKMSTVEALPEIIEAIQAMDDTVIVPITDDTLPVQHIKY